MPLNIDQLPAQYKRLGSEEKIAEGIMSIIPYIKNIT